jgi:ABC-type nitrate/sulfonate/bicarbonate transport system substrate-binding protein
MLQPEIIMMRDFCLTTVRKRCGRWAAICGLTLVLSTVFLNVSGTSTARAATCANMMDAKIQEWTGDIINLVPWVAQDQGIFSKHCVNVTFVPLVSGPGSYAAMVSGTIAFANGAMDGIMRSRVQGVDLRMIGNMYAAQWSALVGRNGLDLPHAKDGYPDIMQDLVGKKIGVTVLGGTTEAYVRSSFEGAGLSASSATFVAVGGVGTAVPALKNGVVDAAMMFGTGPNLAEALGAGKIILDLRKRGVGPAAVQALWGATLSWAAYGPFIEKNADTVAAFTAANNEAIKWIEDAKNRDSVYAIIKKHMPLPSDISDADGTLKKIVDVNADGLGVGLPKSSVDGWNSYLMSLKQIKQPIPYDQLVWKTGRI